jgi:hypothetical protein
VNFTGLNRASGEEQVRRLIYEYTRLKKSHMIAYDLK